MEFYIRAISISFRKYFHIDNKDVKFPFDDHCFSLMIQYKFEFAMEGGRTDTLRTGLPSICRVCDSLTLSCEWRVRLSVSAPSSPAPPIATVCHLPALTPANWHWLANSANVKQGLTKADLNLWSEVCFGVWCSNCDFKKRKKTKMLSIIELRESVVDRFAFKYSKYSRSCCVTQALQQSNTKTLQAMNFSTFKL